MTALLKDDTELFKQFSDNEGFRRWLSDTVFAVTYEEPVGAATTTRGRDSHA
jgi:type I restriction enzyme R subunit